ncbi:metallophosphoesterase family protein [Chloroflexota bacterium]
MRIGLISDTHIPQVAEQLPVEVFKVFSSVDLILHAGDIYETSVLDDLEKIAPVFAARGDDDYAETVRDKRVKDRQILQLEGKTIWLIHENPFTSIATVSSPAWWGDGAKPDVVVFGHEHRVHNENREGILMINPGSPTFLHYKKGLGTLGILEITPEKIDYQTINLSEL